MWITTHDSAHYTKRRVWSFHLTRFRVQFDTRICAASMHVALRQVFRPKSPISRLSSMTEGAEAFSLEDV